MVTGEIVVTPCWFVWNRKMDSKVFRRRGEGLGRN